MEPITRIEGPNYEYGPRDATVTYKATDDKYYELTIQYNTGGINWATGVHEQRGYYMSLNPVQWEFDKNGKHTFTTYIGFTGTKKFLKPAKRFNKKQFDAYFELLKDDRKTAQLFLPLLLQYDLTIAITTKTMSLF